VIRITGQPSHDIDGNTKPSKGKGIGSRSVCHTRLRGNIVTQYIINRVFQGIIAVLVVSIVIFLLMRVAPGDVALMVISQGEEDFNPEDVDPIALERISNLLGLDEPLHMQYLIWLGNVVTLDWGESFYTQKSIMSEFKSRMPVTFQRGLYSVLLAIVIGIPLGIMMALKQDSLSDYAGRIVSLGGLSMPSFWLATMVIAIGVYAFNWSPRLDYAHPWDDPMANLAILFWPALIGGYASAGTKARMMRSTMLEVLRQDYIRTANAKGLKHFVVVYRHAMKNALLPVITVVGISMAVILGGSVIMETIFQLPGIGVYLVRGMNQRDFPVVQSMVAIIAMWIIFTNLVVDVTYAWLDPRIRL
jgi:peptide/nickel transport system permease protein